MGFLRKTLGATLAVGLGLAAPANAIVGGTDASPGEYPFVAYVLIDQSFSCTGTLVDPTHVVTAAHCGSIVPGGIANVPVGTPGQLIQVSIGAHRTPTPTLTGIESDGEQRTGTAVAVNPGWAGLGSVSHDVSVITLDRPSTKTPVKIANASERSLWSAGTLATIAGFGATEEGGDVADTLQEARVPIVTDAKAAETYPYLIEGVDPVFGGFESQTQVGAGYDKGGTDTCQGDSGGPLLVPASSGGFRLVGDTSYGIGCAQPNTPGIYGRLADTTLREWIRTVAPDAISNSTATSSTTKTKGKKPARKAKRSKSVKKGSAGPTRRRGTTRSYR